MPFNFWEWLRSGKFGLLSSDQKAAIITLMAGCWCGSSDASFPDNEKFLARESGLGKKWRKNAEVIKEFMIPYPGKEGYITFPCVLHEWEMKAKYGNREYKEQREKRDVSLGKRFKVLSRDKFTCRYCGRKLPEVKLHCDHIVPLSRGGSNEMSNLITACRECNAGKYSMEIDVESLNG